MLTWTFLSPGLLKKFARQHSYMPANWGDDIFRLVEKIVRRFVARFDGDHEREWILNLFNADGDAQLSQGASGV